MTTNIKDIAHADDVYIDLISDERRNTLPAGAVLAILCPLWRAAPVGARQVRCEACDTLLGVSRRHWEYWQTHRLTSSLLCHDCTMDFRRDLRALAQEQLRQVRRHAPARRRWVQ